LAPGQPEPAPTTAAGAATPPASPTPPSTSGAALPLTVRGVAEGDLQRGIVLDLLPSDSEITEGTLVLTSGLGGNYPRGLLLGSVEALEQRPQSPFTRATVQPAAELSGLDTVLILISFTPARLATP
jgi:rod shape-determining protein MreC